jgi:hypothetical protein
MAVMVYDEKRDRTRYFAKSITPIHPLRLFYDLAMEVLGISIPPEPCLMFNAVSRTKSEQAN